MRALRRAQSRIAKLPRPHPLLALLVVLGVLAGSIAIEESASGRRADLLRARGAYLGALTATKTELASLLARVATDKTLVQNLNWRLTHSVQSALSARLQKGHLDQLMLVDENCRAVAEVRVDGGARIPCPFSSGNLKPDTFYWLTNEPLPVLAMARQVPGVTTDTDLYAVGTVALGSDWLALSPELKKWTTILDLKVGAPGGDATVVASDGDNAADNAPSTALLSTDSWDLYLLSGDGGPFGLGQRVVGPCLVLAFALGGWALLGERRKRRQGSKRHEDLIAWCRSLTPGGGVAIPGRFPAKADEESIQHLVGIALKLKADDFRLVSRRLQAAEAELKGKDQEIKRLKHRLAELAELDSLAVQLARTTKAFLERMGQFRDDAQDLTDLTGDGLAPCARLLTETLGGWQEGVGARGARKFLRGLAETPAASGQDRTRLDEDLALLTTLASELDDQALAATMRARGLLETAEFAAKLAGLWHGIALKTHADKASPSLVPPMDEAQSLILLERPGLEFRNGIGAAEARDIPPLPRTVWVTALYHVYLAMAELTSGTGAIIATRIRKEDGKLMLVVQVAARDQAPLPRRGETEAYHLEVSRSILAPFPVSLTVLPSLDGPFPVAITWQRDAVGTREKQQDGEQPITALPPSKTADAPQGASAV